MANMDLEAKISRIVSKTLYITEKGISSKMANMHKSLANTESMLFAAVHAPNFQLCYGGSMAEGTSSQRSDVDRMLVVPNITVLSSDEENIDRIGHIFRMDSTNCRPGFYVLIQKQTQSRKNDFFYFYQQDIRCMLENDNEEHSCLSSDKMYKFAVLICKKNAPCTYKNTQNGPAVTDAFCFVNGNIINTFDIDFCLGLRVDKWPAEADEWVKRKRTCNWPKQGLIKKIQSLDCHLVPVGDNESPSKHLQWRLSFLLCERELVWSFNDFQMQLYFLLKELLKSKELEDLYPKQLSSYCTKTAVFWYSESHDPNEWNDENLLVHVHDCLLDILSYIIDGNLEHYFNRSRNLLHSKFTDLGKKQNFTEKMNKISENVIPAVLNLLDQKDVIKAWSNSGRDPKAFLQKCENVTFLSTSFHKYRNQHEQLSTFQLLRGTYIPLVSDNCSDLSAKWKYIESHKCDDIDREFFDQVIRIITIRFGLCISLASGWYKDSPDYLLYCLKCAEAAIEKGTYMDRISGYLYLATFYLFCNNLNMAIFILTCMLKTNGETSLIYPGICSMKKGIGITSIGMFFQTECPLLTGDTNISPLGGFDVMFSEKDLLFVPHPVKYECVLLRPFPEGIIMIHPVIYSYFLLTLTTLKLHNSKSSPESRKYLKKLKEAVMDANDGSQYFRALNLLGYCYLRVGRLRSAFKCFRISMTESCYFQNAAIYHIIILTFVELNKFRLPAL